MHSITQRNFLVVLLVLTLCHGLLDRGKNNQPQNSEKRESLKTKRQMQKWKNKLLVNSEMTLSNGEKRDLTITRIQKDDTTIDTVKVDDPKKPEIKQALTQRHRAEAKPEKNGYHVQNILPPNNAKPQFSPQLKMPSSGLKSTKLLDELPVSPLNPQKQTTSGKDGTQLITDFSNVCVGLICFRPRPQPCPTTSIASSTKGGLGIFGRPGQLPPTTGGTGTAGAGQLPGDPGNIGLVPRVQASTTSIIPATTPTATQCCTCPGICVDVNLCVKQLPICSALPPCSTGQCAQNCCHR